MNYVEQIAAKLGFPVIVLPDAAAGSVESAIRFLVDRLVVGGFLHAEVTDEVVRGILKREMLGSTALGEGVALPHSTSSGVDRVIGVLAHCSSAGPWEGPDGQAVRTICLILAPVGRPGDYMRALEQVAQAIRRKTGRHAGGSRPLPPFLGWFLRMFGWNDRNALIFGLLVHFFRTP